MDLDGKKGSSQGVPTRWNSTLLMLQSVLSYWHAFEHLELTDYNCNHFPTGDEWEKAKKIKNFLASFLWFYIGFLWHKISNIQLIFSTNFHYLFYFEERKWLWG